VKEPPDLTAGSVRLSSVAGSGRSDGTAAPQMLEPGQGLSLGGVKAKMCRQLGQFAKGLVDLLAARRIERPRKPCSVPISSHAPEPDVAALAHTMPVGATPRLQLLAR
jgi:hypothetical protein